MNFIKKQVTLLAVFILSISIFGWFSYWSFDPEFSKALDWMSTYKLTKYNTEEWFRPSDNLTREQAAKFFVEYYNTLWIEPNNLSYTWDDVLFIFNDLYLKKDFNKCNFSDINKADPSLVTYIEKACELWLMVWENWKFNPTSKISKAQVITVIWRIMRWVQDENVTPWWNNYYLLAKNIKLTKEANSLKLDRPVLRGEVVLMIYRIAHPQ